MTDEKHKPCVYLVGSGPGDAELLTVRGAQLLKTADCVIYDKLVNPELLKFARPDAEIIYVPKRIGKGSFTQEQINELILAKASEYRIIVRLKGGDPCVFARAAEEALLLANAGIEFEIVPGITAAIAAAEYAGIMLTDRNYSSQLVFVTGQEADNKQISNIDWELLAKFRGTIVFYMGMGNLETIVRRLTEEGMREDTPAAIISNATFPNQRILKAPMNLINQMSIEQKFEAPAIVVLGAAAESDYRLNWFMKKPLFGKNIVVTRDEKGNADFASRIVRHGGNPIKFDTIRLKALTNTTRFIEAVQKISTYDWIIFTSGNGVSILFEFLSGIGKDARIFGSAKIACIGKPTAERLAEFGIKADFVPTVFTSKQLARQLIAFTNLHNKKVLLLRSELGNEELVSILANGNAKTDDVSLYTAVPAETEYQWLKEKISEGTVDWLTFASPFSVEVFFGKISAELVNSTDVRIASIGPITTERLKKLTVKITTEASEHTIEGLVEAIEEYANDKYL